jgi:hypothetical protein
VDLLPGSIIKGTLREAMAQPLVNVPVTINAQTVNPPPGQPVLTDAAGQFEIEIARDEPKETFILTFDHDGVIIHVEVVVPAETEVEVEVEIDENNEAEVVTTPRPLAPSDRVAVVEEGDDETWYSLRLAEDQTSETFGVRADSLRPEGQQFIYLALRQIREVQRDEPSPQVPWRVYRASQEPDGMTWAATLPLGATSAEIHGRNYEVTALAAAVRLADGAAYNTLRGLREAAGRSAVFAPGLLRVFVVTTRQGRFTGAAPGVITVRPNAVLCDCAPSDTLQVSPEDLAQMNLTAGTTVVLDTVPSSEEALEVRIEASDDPILGFATLLLDDDTVEKLSLDLDDRRAGWFLTLQSGVGSGDDEGEEGTEAEEPSESDDDEGEEEEEEGG